MDVKDFSEPYFDPKDWINKTVRSVEHDGNKDAVVNSLLARLQLYFQQLNNDFENTASNIMQNIPRALHDIENLSDEASTLKVKMSAVKEEIAKVERNSGTSIASLEKIDRIKTELVNAKQALYEADNWTVLSADIEAVFEAGDIDVIAAKLVSMQQSLAALSNAADYENKKIHLEGLKNRLEALASPYVVEAFTTRSIEQSKKFVKLFQDIGRLPLLVKYFTKCQKANLVHKWEAQLDLDNEENILETFMKYYELLHQNWQDLLKWCEEAMPQIFAVSALVELYTEVLATLSLEFSKLIERGMKESSEPLQLLLQVKECTLHFAINMKNKIGTSDVKEREVIALAKAIYLPYVQHISKYKTYQQETFHHQLTLITKDGEFVDLVQTLGQKNSKIFALACDAQKLCVDLSAGCAFPGFISALEGFLVQYLNIFRTVTSEIRERSRLEQNDFNMFQMCITVLQNLGSFISSLKQFDQDCVQDIISCDNDLKKCQSDPFKEFLDLFVDSERKRQFNTLVSNLTDANEPSALSEVFTAMESVCRDVYQTSFKVIFAPISTLLESFLNAPAWKSKAVSLDLPDYGFVPQEYITQIGQYLMNLPQLLEPFISIDNPSLNLALSIAGMEYMQLLNEDVEGGGFVEIFIGRIADATCHSYSEQILGINTLGLNACKQLMTDISYLGNVLEDLGFGLSERLKHINFLLKLSPTEYSTQCAGCSPQLVAAIRQMRNLISE